jgi:hypothetical protein
MPPLKKRQRPGQLGRDRLHAWIDRSKLNQREAADLLRVHPVVLSQWLSGARIPGLDNAHVIEGVTGIATESWLLTHGSRATDTESAA